MDAGSSREVNYTNLDPGLYTLHVRAANSNGRRDAGRIMSWTLRLTILLLEVRSGGIDVRRAIWRHRRNGSDLRKKLYRLFRLHGKSGSSIIGGDRLLNPEA